ncbi:MAG TPA: hypothetical protein VGS19_22240 [Streptosporangiaceae bacterium]|nr:hypothetical protein [Streptosporangiaceae bacterium]
MAATGNRHRPHLIPGDQAWFWAPEWQAKEAEADHEIANGGGSVVIGAEESIADLAYWAGLPSDDLT